MDSEELIDAVLNLAEDKEINIRSPPKVYMYKGDCENDSLFQKVTGLGDLCVLACDENVAAVLLFLMEQFFDDHDTQWCISRLTRHLSELSKDQLEILGIESDADITADLAFKVWCHITKKKVTGHSMHHPIVLNPVKDATCMILPSIIDIWTIPRVRRQVTKT